MDCKDECKNFEAKEKSAHKKGERFEGIVGPADIINFPAHHHFEYAGEYRITYAGDWSVQPIVECAFMTEGRPGYQYTAGGPREILLLVPDGPLVQVTWWDNEAVEHSYEFTGPVDWKRLKKECFDKEGAEVVRVTAVEGDVFLPRKDGGILYHPVYIGKYVGIWDCDLIGEGYKGKYSGWDDVTIVAAIREHNPPKPVHDWAEAARKSYYERWLPMCKVETCGEMKAIIKNTECALCTKARKNAPAFPNECPLGCQGMSQCCSLFRDWRNVRTSFPDAHAAAVAMASKLVEIAGITTGEHLDELNPQRRCKTCAYECLDSRESPCDECWMFTDQPKWRSRNEPKPAKSEPPEWWKEGWWVYDKFNDCRLCLDKLRMVPHYHYIDQCRDITLSDLSVLIGGEKCWFVEYADRIDWLGKHGTIATFKYNWLGVDEIPIARAIAAQNNAPLIPLAQWEYLHKGEK